MDITETKRGSDLTVKLNGRFDACAALNLEKKLVGLLPGIMNLEFNFAQVSYIASAGLRVMVQTHKLIGGRKGTLKLVHVNPSVREVFEITRLNKLIMLES